MAGEAVRRSRTQSRSDTPRLPRRNGRLKVAASFSDAYYDQVSQIAAAEERTVASVLSELIFIGLQGYWPAWVTREHERLLSANAREALRLAEENAVQLNHDFVGTEHLLLGILAAREGAGARVLGTHANDVTLQRVREAVVELQPAGAQRVRGRPELTPRTRKVLGVAVREAYSRGHGTISTGHVLLALLRESEGIAARVMVRLGASLDRLRSETVQALPAGDSTPG